MTALGIWLKQIVTIVFLAILADFLLPGKSMQRYVRMVMGLAILAMMLQPIIPVFREDFASKLADAATNEIFGQPSTNTAATANYTAFARKLQSQEQSQERTILAQRLLMSIATSCACTVLSVDIGSFKDGTVDSVTVITPQAEDQVIANRVRAYVSQELQIPAERVRVAVQQEGGVSGGS